MEQDMNASADCSRLHSQLVLEFKRLPTKIKRVAMPSSKSYASLVVLVIEPPWLNYLAHIMNYGKEIVQLYKYTLSNRGIRSARQ